MRLACDTNVLARAILADDPVQSPLAERTLSRADPLVVPIVVLCELVWVLRSKGMGAADVRRVLEAVITAGNVEVDRPVAQAGLDMLDRGGDFADGCILEQARADKCRGLATFDTTLVREGRPFAFHPREID